MAPPRGSEDSFASMFEQTAGAHGRLRRYHTGESVEVTIVAIARDAVFAELGGKQEGFFDRIALADTEGKLHVEVGSRVSAVVDTIDGVTGQVRLRPVMIRAEAGDVGVSKAASSTGAPAAVLVTGARIKGRVTGVERYGVFVQITGTQGRTGRGLVPTAETGTSRGADLKKHFLVGQDVEAKILHIDETGKIRLSISALGADDERGLFEAFKTSQGAPAAAAGAAGAAAPAAGRTKEKPAPRNFGTLADLLPKGLAAAEPKPAAPVAKGAPPANSRQAAPQTPARGGARPQAPGKR